MQAFVPGDQPSEEQGSSRAPTPPEPFASPLRSPRVILPRVEMVFKTPSQERDGLQPEPGPNPEDLDVDIGDEEDGDGILTIAEEDHGVDLVDTNSDPDMPSIPPCAYLSSEECAKRQAENAEVEKSARALDSRFKEMKNDLLEALQACDNLDVSIVIPFSFNFIEICIIFKTLDQYFLA